MGLADGVGRGEGRGELEVKEEGEVEELQLLRC